MNIPKIRFKGFEGEWKKIRLKEIASKSTQKNTDYAIDITLTNSAENGIVNQKDYFDHDISNTDNIGGYFVVQQGDFVYNPRISASAPVGPINKNCLGTAGVMSPLYLVFKIQNTDLDFMSCYFKTSKWHRYMKLEGNTGARFDRLSISDTQFFLMPIVIPILEIEQRAIASFFQNLDSLIQETEKKIASLRQMKEASLQAMFPAEGETVPKVRFKGFDGEWKKVKLGEHGKTTSGIGFPEKEQGGISGIPFYKVSDMNREGNERCMNSSANYVSSEQIGRLHWKVCSSIPAIFFAKVGAAVLLDRKRLVVNPCLCDNNTMMYCLDTSFWDANFCLYLFEHLKLSTLVQVGTLPSYNGNAVENMKERVPSLAEQQKIASYFTALDQQISTQTKRLEKLRQIKSACLDAMFV